MDGNVDRIVTKHSKRIWVICVMELAAGSDGFSPVKSNDVRRRVTCTTLQCLWQANFTGQTRPHLGARKAVPRIEEILRGSWPIKMSQMIIGRLTTDSQTGEDDVRLE